MSYVDQIISTFGGIRAMARRLGRPSSTVAGWVNRGTIPDSEKAVILTIAQADGLGLTAADFFPFDRVPAPDVVPMDQDEGRAA